MDISEPINHFHEVLNESTKLVTSIRVEGDIEENERRIKQEVKIENIEQKLQTENKTSSKVKAAIQMKWASLKEISIPQELNNELNEQKTACKKIIESKDRLIQELNNELRYKDEEYVNSLQKQSKDINLLISRMREQIAVLMQDYETQLANIEAAFDKERSLLLKKNEEVLEEMKQKRRDLEKKSIDDRKSKVDEFQEELETLRNQELEKLAIAKKDLNDQVHNLESTIDKLRGEYHLHSEKLKYFFDGLQHRIEANDNANKFNQKKINTLRNDLTGIKAKYDRDDKKFKATNNEITEQYMRLSKQYKDLILKFKHFEESDTKKHRDVWKMNQEIVEDLVNKLIKFDQVITEQQLGLSWSPPEEDLLKTQMVETMNETSNIEGTSTFPPDKSQLNGETENSPSSELSRFILETLCDNAGFLVEEKVKKTLKELDQDEAKLLKTDAILRALGIEKPGEINTLMSYFIQVIEMNMKTASETSAKSAIDQQTLSVDLLSMDDVLESLRLFMDDQQKSILRQNSSIKKKAKIMNAEERAGERRRKEEKRYWEQTAQVIPESKCRVWNALEKGLEKYQILLQEREKLIEETEMIRMQNNDLRDLLEKYMSQKINEELLIPATYGLHEF